MITQDAFITGKTLIETILQKLINLSKPKRKFISEILMLFLSHRGRMNFLQMERQGNRSEKSFRYQFDQSFDWLTFNMGLVDNLCGEELIIGFDPSYIPKSGKCTPELGNFYSGCAGKHKRGLEIGSFAAIDVKQNTAYHLEAIQTPAAKTKQIGDNRTLVDHYADLLVSRSKLLESISKRLVCDGYFAKRKYVDKVCEYTNMDLICRFRDDADLRYLYNGPKKSGKGRPRKYDGKIDIKNIDKRRVTLEHEEEKIKIYSGVVYSIGLRRKVKLCYVEFTTEKGKKIIKLFFSTNMSETGINILRYYQARFQMEFIFRDAKQYTGLEQCQARGIQKMHFHYNASLTSISIGKGILRNEVQTTQSVPISIADVKTELQNRNMVFRIFSIYGFDHKLIKMNRCFRKALNIGKIAA